MEEVPEEINHQCLICLPFQDFPAVRSVCKPWRDQIERSEFRRDRKASGHTQNVVVIVQVGATDPVNTLHQLTVFEPDTGNWLELPPFPAYFGRLPRFFGLVAVGWDLVVIGGWHPDTWLPLSSVFVYSFLSARWRRGADMPGGPRSLFGCSSDSGRVVYIAGGHDSDKNAMRSALAYDVAADTWVTLPDMARGRDECKGAFHRGKFHVIGGYDTDMQGRFGRCAEAFDVEAWKWGPVDEGFMPAGERPTTCVAIGVDGAMYTCHNEDVVALRGGRWEVVARLPDKVRCMSVEMTWHDRLLVMGSTTHSGPCSAYVLDMKEMTWTKLETSEKCTRCFISGCCLEI